MSTPQAIITGNRDERRTLIVIFQRGAADGLALVPPIEDDHYYRARPRLGIKKADAVRLDDHFGLHPNLRPLAPAWQEGDLAIVHACGIEDDNRSHFEAQDLMEHGGVAAGGWLGRFLRARPSTSGALACVAVGKALPECLLGAPSVTVMQSLNDFALGGKSGDLGAQLERLYAMENGQLGTAARDTFDAIKRIDAMRSQPYRPTNGAVYETKDEFATGLQQLAQLIRADVGLEAASIDINGWDSHFTQETLLNPLATRLAKGLAAFRQDLGERMQTVSIVIMTEFGRTVQENSAFGTDHGRGGAMFVLGGGVQGGRFHGDWKGLGQLVPRGLSSSYEDLPVLNNYRDVLAPILLRHGARREDLAKIFPDFALSPLALYS